MAIVIGYVPKAEGHAALTRAIAEARVHNESLIVINTSRGDAPIDYAYAEEGDLLAVKQELEESGVEHEVRQTVPGRDAAEEIVAAAVESSATLVVIGLRRRSSVGKFVLGSTAQDVLFQAPCPVLSVRADTLPGPSPS